jgi:hypothetical protein
MTTTYTTIIETPELDKITQSQWLKVLSYKPEELIEISTLTKNKVWITAQRHKIPVREMSTIHINRCINCWNGKGKLKIPTNYLGGKSKWLDIFNQELINRQ